MIMHTYRLLWRDAAGHLVKSRSVECSCTQRAVDLAVSEMGTCSLTEILEGTNPVGRYDNSGRGQPGTVRGFLPGDRDPPRRVP